MIEIRPLKSACNLSCRYCYQDTQRQAGNPQPRQNIDHLLSLLKIQDQPFVLFGGEPLLLGRDQMEPLLKYGFDRFGFTSIQSNGVLLETEHLSLFEKYKTRVGLSIDGPGQRNALRWGGTSEKTALYTRKTERGIEKLLSAGIPTSIIVTLHNRNARQEHLAELADWFRSLSEKGIHHIRLHILEAQTEDMTRDYSLSPKELTSAFLTFAELVDELGITFFDVFGDIDELLHGDDRKACCVWRGCDYYHAEAIGALGMEGEITNCGHTHKDGIEFLKADVMGYERLVALFRTPQRFGGCLCCRFFLLCKGHCPASATQHDWRNRSMYCETWKILFSHFEERMVQKGEIPVSRNPARKEWEQAAIREWSRGKTISLYHLTHKN